MFVAQLVRYHQFRVPVWTRLNDLTGLSALHGGVGHATVLVTALALAAFVVGTAVAASLVRHRPPPPLEWFAALTTALVVLAFMWPPGFFFHFPAFLAPFLALALALPVSRLLPRGRAGAWPGWVATAVTCVVIGGFAVIQAGSETTLAPRVGPAAIAAVRRVIPPGACVLTDQVSFTIAASRFSSSQPGCAEMIDPLGTDYALTPGRDGLHRAGRFPAAAAIMRQAFGHAQYVWLAGRYNQRRIAWSLSLRAYFSHNFTRVLTDDKGDALYVRNGIRR